MTKFGNYNCRRPVIIVVARQEALNRKKHEKIKIRKQCVIIILSRKYFITLNASELQSYSCL